MRVQPLPLVVRNQVPNLRLPRVIDGQSALVDQLLAGVPEGSLRVSVSGPLLEHVDPGPVPLGQLGEDVCLRFVAGLGFRPWLAVADTFDYLGAFSE